MEMHTSTAKILGVSFLRGDVIGATRKGLPAKSVDRLAKTGGLTDQQVARALGISPRTLLRIRAKSDGRLGPVESDRAIRLARLLAIAASIFGDANNMRGWLHDPILALGGRAPVDYLDTDAGLRRIEDVLGLIDYGGIS
jgi:putative toxin-antitoxin system antitoxin component (TIGR02293 family)